MKISIEQKESVFLLIVVFLVLLFFVFIVHFLHTKHHFSLYEKYLKLFLFHKLRFNHNNNDDENNRKNPKKVVVAFDLHGVVLTANYWQMTKMCKKKLLFTTIYYYIYIYI